MTAAASDHSPLDERYCPACEYELGGLAANAPCPECGSETGPRARATAAMARAAVDTRSRLLLLASPGIGIVAGGAALAARGLIAAGLILFTSVAAGGILAILRIGRAPGAEPMLGRILVLGTVLGVAYLTLLITAALLAVFPIALLAAVFRERLAPGGWLVIVALTIGVALAFAVLGIIAAVLRRFARHSRRR